MKLEARRRVGHGKGAGRRIRDRGLIPAIMYGADSEAASLAVDPRHIKRILAAPRGRNTMFAVEVAGGESVALAMVKDYQIHPLKRTLLHVDIQRLDADKPRNFKVPIRIDGTAPAEKEGAKVRFITRHVVVTCKPNDVPDVVVVDVSAVQATESIRLSDVAAPENTELFFKQNAPVFAASGVGSAIEEEEEEAGAAAVEE
ncbi:MAG: large subunit ribosomal protein L25 [Myxococcota bacterium]